MDYFKTRILGTKRGLYGLILSLVSVIALCWMLYARDDARAEYEELKANGTCFAEKVDESWWNNLSSEEKKKISRKCMAASQRLSQTELAPSIFAVLAMIGFMLLASSFANIKSDADKILEAMEKEEEEKKGGEDDNKLS